MCAVSAIYGYGQSMPNDWWNRQRLGEFDQLVRQAQQFDRQTNQPDCEDPEKMRWYREIERRVREEVTG